MRSDENLDSQMNVIGMIADHPTPKIKEEGAAYTINSRDYKGVMLIVIAKENEKCKNTK